MCLVETLLRGWTLLVFWLWWANHNHLHHGEIWSGERLQSKWEKWHHIFVGRVGAFAVAPDDKTSYYELVLDLLHLLTSFVRLGPPTINNQILLLGEMVPLLRVDRHIKRHSETLSITQQVALLCPTLSIQRSRVLLTLRSPFSLPQW